MGGSPVPERLSTAVLLLNELLMMVTAPLIDPIAFGLNVTCIVQEVCGGMLAGQLLL